MIPLAELGDALLRGVEELRETEVPHDNGVVVLRIQVVSVVAPFLDERAESPRRVEIGAPGRPLSRIETSRLLRKFAQPVAVDLKSVRRAAPEAAGKLQLTVRFL